MMKLEKPPKGLNLGFHVKSEPATRHDIGTAMALGMYFDEVVSKLVEEKGYKIWSLAYCQCSERHVPVAFFVVSKELLKGNTKNTSFPSRYIFNPVILEAPEEVEIKKPERKTVWNEKIEKRELKDVVSVYKVSNKVKEKELHVHFMQYKPRNVERYHAITVRYWYPVKLPWLNIWVLWRKTERVEGMKSIIFQQELDHINATSHYALKSKS